MISAARDTGLSWDEVGQRFGITGRQARNVYAKRTRAAPEPVGGVIGELDPASAPQRELIRTAAFIVAMERHRLPAAAQSELIELLTGDPIEMARERLADSRPLWAARFGDELRETIRARRRVSGGRQARGQS
jgi:hypothetical protein